MNIHNEKTFYPALLKDMYNAENEVIIYSPFISKYRADFFREPLSKLKRRNINVFIFTRHVEEHEKYIQNEVRQALEVYKKLGVHIIYLSGSIHQKIAIIDRKILWEGSMNILSQRSSREIMKRIANEDSVRQIMSHLKLTEKLAIKAKTGNPNLGILTSLRQAFISVVRWSLFTFYRVLIIVLKSVLAVFNILDAIFN